MFVVCPTLAGYNPKLHHLEVYFVNGFILTNIERTSARFILGDRRPMEGIKRKIVKMTLETLSKVHIYQKKRSVGHPKDKLKKHGYLIRFGHTKALLKKKMEKGHKTGILTTLQKLTHM